MKGEQQLKNKEINASTKVEENNATEKKKEKSNSELLKKERRKSHLLSLSSGVIPIVFCVILSCVLLGALICNKDIDLFGNKNPQKGNNIIDQQEARQNNEKGQNKTNKDNGSQKDNGSKTENNTNPTNGSNSYSDNKQDKNQNKSDEKSQDGGVFYKVYMYLFARLYSLTQ